MKLNVNQCRCNKPPVNCCDYDISFLGIDPTNGRFADVTIERCTHCGNLWINYLVEFEAFSGSGRWYRGILSEEAQKIITPETVVDYLEKLEWYIFGGTYFDSTGMVSKGKVIVDL